MTIKRLEEVLAEMRKARFADEAQLRAWETQIADAITDELKSQIDEAIAAPALATQPGGHDWE